MTEQIRWGILSTAYIGRKSLIPAMHEARNGIPAAVASRDIGKARAFAEATGIPKVYGSYEDLLADPAIDAIYNPLPNSLHAEWTMKAADAGKPVLCEKPFTVTSAEAQQVVGHFRARGLPVAEAFMYRYHPQTARVVQMVQDGAVGDLHSIHASFTVAIPNPDENIRFKRETGGGSLFDLGCYPLSIMRLLAGEPEFTAATGVLNDEGVDLSAGGVLQFPAGVTGTIISDMTGFRAQNVDIRGTDGRIYVRTPFSIPKDQSTVTFYWHGDEYEEISTPPTNHYVLMLEDFADAVLTGRPPRFPAEDAVLQMAALEKLVAQAASTSPA
ncbi:MAG: Gfo/Idh/MocA family oxidoreductase [Anaerolineae bacterium]|nr:Gfo/Idh/MocA family oxidoreductase [Anaerolineae bacterium]